MLSKENPVAKTLRPTMVSCLQDVTAQQWHKANESKQATYNLNLGPLYAMEPYLMLLK